MVIICHFATFTDSVPIWSLFINSCNQLGHAFFSLQESTSVQSLHLNNLHAQTANFLSHSTFFAISAHMWGMTALAQDFPILNRENMTFSGLNQHMFSSNAFVRLKPSSLVSHSEASRSHYLAIWLCQLRWPPWIFLWLSMESILLQRLLKMFWKPKFCTAYVAKPKTQVHKILLKNIFPKNLQHFVEERNCYSRTVSNYKNTFNYRVRNKIPKWHQIILVSL